MPNLAILDLPVFRTSLTPAATIYSHDQYQAGEEVVVSQTTYTTRASQVCDQSQCQTDGLDNEQITKLSQGTRYLIANTLVSEW